MIYSQSPPQKMKTTAACLLLLVSFNTVAVAKPIKLQCFYYDMAKQEMTLVPSTERTFVVDDKAGTVQLNGVLLPSAWEEHRLSFDEADSTNTDSNLTGTLLTKIDRYTGDLTQYPVRRTRAGTQVKLDRRELRLGKCSESKPLF